MIERAYHHQDLDALTKLWLAHRVVTSVEIYPTIWRSRLLLSSRVWEPDRDTRVWLSLGGDIRAFAMLWRRSQTSPYIVLDYCVNPGAVTKELFQAVLDWGTRRTQAIANHQDITLSLFAQELRNLDTHQIFERSGFKRFQADGQDYNVYFVRNLEAEVIIPELPMGYTIIHLQSSKELAAYDSLYGFASVDRRHLEEQLVSEEYSHFVIANPEGQFAAYCETSICRAEWQLSNQRIGWIDYIGTRPDDRRKGLSLNLLLHGLQKLQEQGAECARLVTISSNLPAINLYLKAGFHAEERQEPASYQITLHPK